MSAMLLGWAGVGEVRVRYPLSISTHPSALSEPAHRPSEKGVRRLPSRRPYRNRAQAPDGRGTLFHVHSLTHTHTHTHVHMPGIPALGPHGNPGLWQRPLPLHPNLISGTSEQIMPPLGHFKTTGPPQRSNIMGLGLRDLPGPPWCLLSTPPG